MKKARFKVDAITSKVTKMRNAELELEHKFSWNPETKLTTIKMSG